MKLSVILLAGGVGRRMGTSIPKQFLPLGGKPIVSHSFDLFSSLPFVTEIVVVAMSSEWHLFPNATRALPGKRRQDSLKNGFEALTQPTGWICVHDSARPFVTEEIVEMVFSAAFEVGAATCSAPVTSTIKQVNADNQVIKTLDRSTLMAIQTPQILRSDLVKEGLARADAEDLTLTDDVSLAEILDHPVRCIPAPEWNLKITTQTDYQLAQILYESHL